jgi:hypothetical protein
MSKSKRSYSSWIWGGLLIALGLGLLVENLDLLGDWNAPIWSLILGAISLIFLVTFISDRGQWWALIPGLVILGLAVAVFLAEQDLVAGYVVATIILSGIGVPFLLIFLTDRKHWWALIPGMTMIGIAGAVFLEGIGIISGAAVGGLVVGGIAMGFLVIYLIDREQWWALIPGGIMGTVAFFLLVATVAEYVWPVALILLGLLLLRGGLVGGRHPPRGAERVSAPTPPTAKPAKRERKRLPTIEEQIKEAIAEEPEVVQEAEVVTEPESEKGEAEPAVNAPPAPKEPEPPDEPQTSQA